MAKKTATKRNAQDATLRNINALKKRCAKLEAQVAQLHLNEQYLAGALLELKGKLK